VHGSEQKEPTVIRTRGGGTWLRKVEKDGISSFPGVGKCHHYQGRDKAI